MSNIVNTRGHFYKNINAENIKSKLNNSLVQNHPNPFNPSTKLSYSIAQKSNVKLRVYNSLGQVVAVLIDEIQGEGNYTVPFSAKGGDTTNLPSGVYFYQLITDHFSDVKNMVVAK